MVDSKYAIVCKKSPLTCGDIMLKLHRKTLIYFCFLSILFNNHFIIIPCTGIRLHTQDNSVIYARTLEWRKKLNPHAIIIPRNTEYTGTSTAHKQGLHWTTIYTFTGITIGDLPFVIDGVNEQGLAAGLFSFRDDIEYHIPDENTENDLAPWELVTYILSTCSTVDEIKARIADIKIVPVYFELAEEIPPLHYVVHDSNGECIVLEHSYHTFKIYHNPLGIITNSPTFDWHMTHLNTYLNPSFDDHKTAHFTDITKNQPPFKPLHESYALGLPSDFSSPSRFIRAAIYTLCSPVAETGYAGVLQAFHILNQFDIPKGAHRYNVQDYFTYTHWTSVANLKEKKYYFRTHENQRIRMIDLNKTHSINEKIIWFSMDAAEDIEELI